MVRVDPPIERWPVPLNGRPSATGHQASLWHPGILAKFLAVRVAGTPRDKRPLHLVVDQDAHDALNLDLPARRGQGLVIDRVRLAPCDPNIPTGWQPPADADFIRRTLRDKAAGERLIEAFTDLPDCRSLAEQVATVVERLMEPYAGSWKTVFASELGKWFDYDELLHDARRCVDAYNRAVEDHPASNMTKLQVRGDRVELPVWAIRWQQPRQRVFADLSSDKPAWVFDNNETIDRRYHDLAPRALLLTAIMRSERCGLFVHGTGGMAYDRATEAWWWQWRRQKMAPVALATADLRLAFDAPVADREDLHHAVWYRHHLPHNIDRAAGRPDPRKRRLFNVKGQAAFDELHRINDALVSMHPEPIAKADRAVAEAKIGIANAAVARKRDWCFALYDSHQLQALRRAICRTIPL